MFVAKKVLTNNISPVTQRYDWTTGTVYDYYQDSIDMFQRDSNNLLLLKFYVRNRYDQVFKCLWNANGAQSTFEPYFQPGSYGTNNIFTGADGYSWKYLYTIDAGSKKSFMDSNWIPVPVGTNNPDPYLTSGGTGDIEVMNIVSGGTGYDATNSFITVTVTGDGTTPATANAYVSNGAISSIVVSNTGKNYTYANVTINTYSSANLLYPSTYGSGAVVNSPVSPIGGHGFDPVSELGCNRVMLSVEFNGSENGYIPTDIDYRQIGVVSNPTALSTYPNLANAAIYSITTNLNVTTGLGNFISDETVVQKNNAGVVIFSATVLSFDYSGNVVKLINTSGTPVLNSLVYGQTSGTSRVLLSVNTPDFIQYSGYITYIENRTGIQRSIDGIENYRFILAY
jgi:hypothetical protein